MAATTVKRGDTTFRERPDSPEWDFGTQKVSCTRTFEGLYADCLTKVPPIGSSMQGYDAKLLVENVKIKKAISGKATMTVLAEYLADVGNNEFPAPVQPVFEVEWVQLERPLEQHPKFKALFPDPKGETTFTDAQIAALNDFNAWENATDATSRQATYAALSAAFKTLAQKKMRGQTTYLLFAPTARITTLARNVTLASGCGKQFTAVPGFSELPEGYAWLSTADHSTRTGTNGKWQRVQEWTGADTWDVDIYSASEDQGQEEESGGGAGSGGSGS